MQVKNNHQASRSSGLCIRAHILVGGTFPFAYKSKMKVGWLWLKQSATCRLNLYQPYEFVP
jgi:hypothetical protein